MSIRHYYYYYYSYCHTTVKVLKLTPDEMDSNAFQ